jgi:putative ABC transport system permease protein
MTRLASVTDVIRDLAHAFRTLIRQPGFSSVVVFTLAIAIGANAAVFTVVNSLLLRPLPVFDPDTLAVLASGDGARRDLRTWPFGVWQQVQRHSHLFDGTAAWSLSDTITLSHADGEREMVDGVFVSGGFFSTLGVSPLVGRMLTADDDVPGGGREGPTVVISAALWQRRFGASPSAVGTPIVIDRVPFTVVGVMPSTFLGTDVGRAFDVAMPIHTEPLLRGTGSIDNRAYWLRILLRLKRDQAPTAATQLLRSVQPQIAERAFSEAPAVNREYFLKQPLAAVPAAGGVSSLRYEYERPLLALLMLAALVLLIACANIANLVLARATHRQHELRVQLALGAPRARIARQLLSESALLAVCGGTLGLGVAFWGSRALVSQLSTPLTRAALDLSFDWRVIAFVSAASLATVVLFGVVPALRAARLPVAAALKDDRFSDLNRVRGSRGALLALPKSLLVGQVAISVVVVVTAGLFLGTLASLETHSLGFDDDRVLIVNVGAQRTGVATEARAALFDAARDAARAVPGVAHAAMSLITPLSNVAFGPEIHVSGPGAPGENTAAAPTFANIVSPGWFDTMGTRLITGRDFTVDDRRGSRPVVIVNETWARTFVNGANPIGHTVTVASPYTGTPMEVVGVAADATYVSLRDPAPATMYFPLAQFDGEQRGSASVNVVVRSVDGPPGLLTKALASALSGVDPGLSLQFRPLADHVDAALMQARLVARLATVFAAVVLLLAALGIYGVTAYSIARRRHEIGIRLAVGARRTQVLALVLRQATVVTAFGLVVGIAVAAAVTRYIGSMLFGVTPQDPRTFLAVTLLFTIVAAAASYLAARRAAGMDPLAAMGLR